MAKKRITIGKSNGTSSTVDFNIPESPGTYRISATLENGTALTAGNIVVNGTANTYKITVGLSNGSSVNAGTFTTPRISYKLTISSKPTGVATHTVYRNGVALSNGATIYYGETLTQSATAESSYSDPSVNWSSIVVTGNVTATATAGSYVVGWKLIFNGSTTVTSSSPVSISGLRANTKTRATFSGRGDYELYDICDNYQGNSSYTINQRTDVESDNGKYYGSNSGCGDWDCWDYGFELDMSGNPITIKPTGDAYYCQVTITRIEQYY